MKQFVHEEENYLKDSKKDIEIWKKYFNNYKQ